MNRKLQRVILAKTDRLETKATEDQNTSNFICLHRYICISMTNTFEVWLQRHRVAELQHRICSRLDFRWQVQSTLNVSGPPDPPALRACSETILYNPPCKAIRNKMTAATMPRLPRPVVRQICGFSTNDRPTRSMQVQCQLKSGLGALRLCKNAQASACITVLQQLPRKHEDQY